MRNPRHFYLKFFIRMDLYAFTFSSSSFLFHHISTTVFILYYYIRVITHSLTHSLDGHSYDRVLIRAIRGRNFKPRDFLFLPSL